MWVISKLENIHHFDSIQISLVLRIGKSFWLNFSYANVHNLINYMNHLHKLSEFNRHDAITHNSQVNKWIGKKGRTFFCFFGFIMMILNITKIRGGIYFVCVLSPFFHFIKLRPCLIVASTPTEYKASKSSKNKPYWLKAGLSNERRMSNIELILAFGNLERHFFLLKKISY